MVKKENDSRKTASGSYSPHTGRSYLFLLGLFTGLVMPLLSNPRMGLSSHLEGILNGFFLAILGLIWPYIALTAKGKKLLAILALYGSYINWLTTLAAAYW